MNTRIRQFMDYKGISASELADSISVQRSNVTHVLHGRNKPSFQFISKLLETYPEINAKWLILGTGEMLESGSEEGKNQQTLFSEIKGESPEAEAPPKQSSTIVSEEPIQVKREVQEMQEVRQPISSAPPNKEIERIVVFYTDQTFREYGPAK